MGVKSIFLVVTFSTKFCQANQICSQGANIKDPGLLYELLQDT